MKCSRNIKWQLFWTLWLIGRSVLLISSKISCKKRPRNVLVVFLKKNTENSNTFFILTFFIESSGIIQQCVLHTLCSGRQCLFTYTIHLSFPCWGDLDPYCAIFPFSLHPNIQGVMMNNCLYFWLRGNRQDFLDNYLN